VILVRAFNAEFGEFAELSFAFRFLRNLRKNFRDFGSVDKSVSVPKGVILESRRG
jgi:hypothetical protein